MPVANVENLEISSLQRYFPFPFRPLLLFHDGYVYQLYSIPPGNLNFEKRPQTNSIGLFNFDNQQVSLTILIVFKSVKTMKNLI